MLAYYLWFIPFTIILYMMWVDENIAIYVGLTFKLIKVKLDAARWILLYHPFWITNPISKRLSIRKYERMAEKLLKKIE
jgi:hypothetical protein